MNEPKHEHTCPVCGIAVALWRSGECPFHHYFHMNRAKHTTYKELVESFVKEPHDMNRRANEERNHETYSL
jgi:NADH dehydrogenase/NADH:ubiquinone oxidoreductase subunit G